MVKYYPGDQVIVHYEPCVQDPGWNWNELEKHGVVDRCDGSITRVLFPEGPLVVQNRLVVTRLGPVVGTLCLFAR